MNGIIRPAFQSSLQYAVKSAFRSTINKPLRRKLFMSVDGLVIKTSDNKLLRVK